MSIITIIINTLIVFIESNLYILNDFYKLKLPIILISLLFILINIFPSLFTKKLYDKKLLRIKNGYRLLIMFLVSTILSVVLYIVSFFTYNIPYQKLLFNLISLLPVLSTVFWNGMLRSYIFSRQLGIRYRIFGFILGMVPVANIVMLILIIHVCRKEVKFENAKAKLNLERKKDEVCKTKYPILLVHGIFFRDYEKVNYWGRIPNELVQNGATIYYGNHSSSLHVKDSAEEIANRIKDIIKETGCKKVNVIAHSKGGLDTRYAISNLGMDKYIASLTMINTPNHGCLYADYLMTKAPKKIKNKIASGYNFTLKKLGDKEPDFIAGVNDLTHPETEKLNRIMPNSKNVYYQAFGSVLNRPATGSLPLNLTGAFVKQFDGKNDGLVGIDSFPIDKDFTLIGTNSRGLSHGDVIDLNRENINGFDVREFYVQLVNDLKNKGF